MKETAIVENVFDGNERYDVILKKIRPETCQHCNTKALCGVKNEFSFKAVNSTNEKLIRGDIVEFTLPEISVSKLAFLVYGIPLLIFLAVLFLMIGIFKTNEYIGVSLSLVSLFGTYFITAIYDKKIFRKSEAALPKIIRKI